MIRLDPGQPAPVEPKSAVFTDGTQLGLILLTNFVSSIYFLILQVVKARTTFILQLLLDVLPNSN